MFTSDSVTLSALEGTGGGWSILMLMRELGQDQGMQMTGELVRSMLPPTPYLNNIS